MAVPSGDGKERTKKPTRPRRTRRHPIGDVYVTVEAPTLSEEGWIVPGVDINADGMGLELPPEIPEGTFVLLSCHLGAELSFARLPAQVVHSKKNGAGVRFAAWHERERLMLLDYLLRRQLGEVMLPSGAPPPSGSAGR